MDKICEVYWLGREMLNWPQRSILDLRIDVLDYVAILIMNNKIDSIVPSTRASG